MRRILVLLPCLCALLVLAGCGPSPQDVVNAFNKDIDLEHPKAAREQLTPDANTSWAKGDIVADFPLNMDLVRIIGTVNSKNESELTVKAELLDTDEMVLARLHYRMEVDRGRWKISEVKILYSGFGQWKTIGEGLQPTSADQEYEVPDRPPGAVGGPGVSPTDEYTSIPGDISVSVTGIQEVQRLESNTYPGEPPEVLTGDFVLVNMLVKNETDVPREIFYRFSSSGGDQTQFLLLDLVDRVYGNTVDTEDFTMQSSSRGETLNPGVANPVNVAFRVPASRGGFQLIVRGWKDDDYIEYDLGVP